ncbi:hypothetical protein PMAYCL1PPCAC_15829, partial [Pristionchus mayeri]
RWVISAFTTIHSHSFLILSFHFVYRYIAVAKLRNGTFSTITLSFRYQWMHLFRSAWFIGLLIFCLVFESIIWFCMLFFCWKTEPATFDELIPQIRDEFPTLTIDGVATAHYWKHDNSLRWRPFLGYLGFCTIMSIVLCIVVFCAVNIVHALRTIVKSQKAIALQRQLFYTLLAQVFSVPFVLMYSPVVLVITPTLMHASFDLPYRLMPTFFVPFPILDALVILIGVRDYR